MRERFIARDLKFREMACDSRKKTLQQVTSISHLLQILRILSFKQKIKNKCNLIKEEEFRETRVTFLMQYIIILEKPIPKNAHEVTLRTGSSLRNRFLGKAQDMKCLQIVSKSIEINCLTALLNTTRYVWHLKVHCSE